MLLFDANILIYAHGRQSDEQHAIADWFAAETSAGHPFGMAESVLASFMRVVTNRRLFSPPTPGDEALDICAKLRAAEHCVLVRPGQQHWPLFDRLCRATGATANLIPDAYLAALAIEHGCEWVTADRDFAKFPGLTWRHPLRGGTVVNPG